MGWFVARSLPVTGFHGRLGAVLGFLSVQFFGSLPGEPGKTIRKAGAPFTLIIQDSYEFYCRIKFIYETGGISYETWKKFDSMNQKTGLLPRVGMFQHWRLRFVKLEREYKEVMEERERSRLGLVGWIATHNIKRAKRREEREAKGSPGGYCLRFWRPRTVLQESATEDTSSKPPDALSPESSDSDTPSTADKLVARVVWGEDPDPFVSELARKEAEKEEAERKRKKERKGGDVHK